jgi:hypothetical protein
VAVFAAYFDDSNRDGVLSIAGYVARQEAWDEVFTPAWRHVLNNAPHLLSEFKASDCRSMRGEFAGWTRPECDAITREFVDVLIQDTERENFLGLGIAVRLPAVESLPAFASMSEIEREKLRKRHFDGAFELCLKMILIDVLSIGAKLLDTSADRLEIVLDRQDKQVGRSWVYFDDMCALIGDELKCVLPIPKFDDSKAALPLQAADLLAHESARELINRGPPRERRMSIALSRLVETRWHMGSYIEPDLLNEYRRRSVLGLPMSDLKLGILYRSDDLAARVEAQRKESEEP